MNDQSDWIKDKFTVHSTDYGFERWDKVVYLTPDYIKLSLFKENNIYYFNIGDYQLNCLYLKFSNRFIFNSLEEGKLHVDKIMSRILNLKSFI